VRAGQWASTLPPCTASSAPSLLALQVCAQRLDRDEAVEQLGRSVSVDAERHVFIDAVVAERLLGRVDGGAERAHGGVWGLVLDTKQARRRVLDKGAALRLLGREPVLIGF